MNKVIEMAYGGLFITQKKSDATDIYIYNKLKGSCNLQHGKICPGCSPIPSLTPSYLSNWFNNESVQPLNYLDGILQACLDSQKKL